MQAIEFKATAYKHAIRIPASVPDGVVLRVLVLLDDASPSTSEGEASTASAEWKSLLGAMPNVGADQDFIR